MKDGCGPMPAVERDRPRGQLGEQCAQVPEAHWSNQKEGGGNLCSQMVA